MKAARDAGVGFWPSEDVSESRVARIKDLSDLPKRVMFPKLYAGS